MFHDNHRFTSGSNRKVETLPHTPLPLQQFDGEFLTEPELSWAAASTANLGLHSSTGFY